MEDTMIVTVADMVISDLTTMYSDQPTFHADKIAVIVNKVVEEVVKARRYREENYSDEQIEADLYNYKSQIYSLAEYDFSKFGAPHETSHSENSTSRTWSERNKLFSGIIPLAHLSERLKKESKPEEKEEITEDDDEMNQ